MMLNLRIVELLDLFLNYLPIGSIIGLILFFEIYYLLKVEFSFFDYYEVAIFVEYIDILYLHNNLQLLGEVLFNYNSCYIIIASLILFISMLGSIMITFEKHVNISLLKNDDQRFKKRYISFWKKI